MTSSQEGNQELCLALMHAESQDKVVALLEHVGYWSEDSVWRFLGDQEGNWSSIGNQQSEAVAALIEKIVNESTLVSSTLVSKLASIPRPQMRLSRFGQRCPDSSTPTVTPILNGLAGLCTGNRDRSYRRGSPSNGFSHRLPTCGWAPMLSRSPIKAKDRHRMPSQTHS